MNLDFLASATLYSGRAGGSAKNILEREHKSSKVTGSVLTLFLYLSLSLVFEWSHLVKFDFTLFLTVMQVS